MLGLARAQRGEKLAKVEWRVSDPAGPVEKADVTVRNAAGETIGNGQTDAQGRLAVTAPSGKL